MDFNEPFKIKMLIERYSVLTKIKEYFVEFFGNHVNIRTNVTGQIIFYEILF